MMSIILVSSCSKPTSLIENPSSTIYNLTLNGQAASASSMTSFPSAGFTATSGNTLQTWTIETKTLDAVTEIALTNSPNLKGPIRYRFYDSFDLLADVVGANVGDIVSVMGENVERIVISTDTPTTDGQPPKGLKLVLNGCFKRNALATKAQVENAVTTKGTSKPHY
jgi:hypothetical protein